MCKHAHSHPEKKSTRSLSQPLNDYNGWEMGEKRNETNIDGEVKAGKTKPNESRENKKTQYLSIGRGNHSVVVKLKYNNILNRKKNRH